MKLHPRLARWGLATLSATALALGLVGGPAAAAAADKLYDLPDPCLVLPPLFAKEAYGMGPVDPVSVDMGAIGEVQTVGCTYTATNVPNHTLVLTISRYPTAEVPKMIISGVSTGSFPADASSVSLESLSDTGVDEAFLLIDTGGPSGSATLRKGNLLLQMGASGTADSPDIARSMAFAVGARLHGLFDLGMPLS